MEPLEGTGKDIVELYETLKNSEDPEEESVNLLAYILYHFIVMVMLDMNFQIAKPPCNSCPRNYDADDFASCVFSRSTIMGIYKICFGVIRNAEGFKTLIQPEVVSKLNLIMDQCEKMLARCK
jgi:hypothetical protein